MQVNIHQINTVQQYGLLNGGNAGGHLTSSLDPSSAAAGTSLIGLKSIIGCYTSKNAQSTSGPRGEAPFGSNPSVAAGGLIQLAKANLNSTGRVGRGGGGGFNLKIKLKNETSFKNLSNSKKKKKQLSTSKTGGGCCTKTMAKRSITKDDKRSVGAVHNRSNLSAPRGINNLLGGGGDGENSYGTHIPKTAAI
jgi:hypothetical protein